MAAEGDLVSVDEEVFPSASSTRGSSPIGQECPELFFAFFLGPFFLHGFSWLLFGFFPCVLVLAHGYAPCVVSGATFFLCRSEANGSEPGRKSIDGVMCKIRIYRGTKGEAEVLAGKLGWMEKAQGDGGNIGGWHGKKWK